MKNIPEISVIMSVYNEEKYLEQAINSILNQTYKKFEFIIINDGSNDKTEEILKKYNDERLIIINQQNMGIVTALNKAIKLSSGKYLARMDGDDISLPNRLELQLKFFKEHNEAGIVGTTFYEIDNKGMIISVIPVLLEDEMIRTGLLVNNQFCHGSIMIKKEVFEKVGYYREKYKYAEDYDLYFRAIKYFKVYNLKEILYKWRKSGEKDNKQQQESTLLIKKDFFEEIKQFGELKFRKDDPLKKLRQKKFSDTCYTLGKIFYKKTNQEQARQYFLLAIKYCFYYFKPYIFLILSFFKK